MDEPKRAVGYIRVSSVSQIEGTSLEFQREQIEYHCKMKGLTLVHVFCDAGVSGGKLIEARPEGKLLMESVENGEADCVVVTKMDRMFRNTIDCLQTIARLDSFDCGLHILNLGGSAIDTKTPTGRFMISVMAATDEMERANIAERCRNGRIKSKAKGKSIGGTPYGLTKTDDNFLIPNQQEQEVIQIIKELKAEGWTARSIAIHLNDRGISSKKGRSWQATQIIRILEAA